MRLEPPSRPEPTGLFPRLFPRSNDPYSELPSWRPIWILAPTVAFVSR